MGSIDFWFLIGSTYSFLTVMRLPKVEAATGATFRWRPFNVRQIMIEMDNIPFAKKPAKRLYVARCRAACGDAREGEISRTLSAD